MAGANASPDDRWQQLIRAFDPERNIRALAELMEQAASASEQVVESVTTNGPGQDGGAPPLRDAVVELERSFARVYDAAGRFMVQRPLAAQSGGATAAGPAAEIAVLDGVGTTVVTIADAENVPHCGDLRRHDGVTLPHDAVTILRSRSFDGDGPTFVVRIDVAESTDPGTYHGQLLVEGLPDIATPIVAKVVSSNE